MEDKINLLIKIDREKLPKHLAIIMDGNGRWAKQQGFFRTIGHQSGSKSVTNIIHTCVNLGIENLTLFAFSTENWNRPKLEIDALMKILVHSLRKETESMIRNNIRLNIIGNTEKLPNRALAELREVMNKTKDNTGLTLTLALSYGAREEIINAVKNIANKVKDNIISVDTIDDSIINEHLYTQNLPEVDLLIRTSGEYRISNFLLWQIAYAELYFTNVLWPDFKEEDLYEAIINYQKRERRFGKTSEQIK